MVVQTETTVTLLRLPEKESLVEPFLGKALEGLRTPAMVIDRKLFAQNCARMHKKARDWGATFRAHLKTHKVVNGGNEICSRVIIRLDS